MKRRALGIVVVAAIGLALAILFLIEAGAVVNRLIALAIVGVVAASIWISRRRHA